MARKKGGGISDSTLGIASIVVAASAGALLLVSNRASASSGGGGGGGGGGGTTYDVHMPSGASSETGLASLSTAEAAANALGSGAYVVDHQTGAVVYTAGGGGGGGCTAQQCPCGQFWDAVLCTCMPLQPAAIQAPPNETIDMGWDASVTWGNVVTKVGILTDPSSCPGSNCADATAGGPTDWSQDTWVIDITGTVVTALGKPVCGVTVSASVSQPSIPWQAGGMAGNALFGVGLRAGEYGPPAPIVTDANGQFTVSLYVTLQVTQGNAGVLTDLAGSGGGATQVFQTVSYLIQGTAYGSQTALNVRMQVCSQNDLNGC